MRSVRGTATSGYVQRNYADVTLRNELKRRNRELQRRRRRVDNKQRKLHPKLVRHAKRREVELEVMRFRLRLEKEGVEQIEVEKRVKEKRIRLLDDLKNEFEKEEGEVEDDSEKQRVDKNLSKGSEK